VRRDGDEIAARLQDPVQVGDERQKVPHMLEDVRPEDAVERRVGKRQRRRLEVVPDVGERAGVEIEVDEAGFRVLRAAEIQPHGVGAADERAEGLRDVRGERRGRVR
jgi:hypothetical protein